MISSESLKNSEVSENLDYDEFLDEFPDDENIDNLGFSDEPLEEVENTYMTMKDVDDLDKQVVDRYSQRAQKDIAPLQNLGQNITETADLNASAYEMLSEKLDDVQEEKEKALAFISKFKGFDEDTLKEITEKQAEFLKDDIVKFFNESYSDAFMIIKTQVENFVDKIIQDNIQTQYAEAEKRLDAKLEACRLAEESLDKKKEELNKQREEIQQKIDEFIALQDAKKTEVEDMINSLTAQNEAAQEVISFERKNNLQLKIVIEEQNKTIVAQTEQAEKLINTIKEENDQKAQILLEKEELFDVIQKKDEKRSVEVNGYKEEIDNLRQAVDRREEKMDFNNSVLIYLLAVFLIIWGFVGVISVPEIHSWLKSFVNIISWSSLVVGFIIGGFKIYRGVQK